VASSLVCDGAVIGQGAVVVDALVAPRARVTRGTEVRGVVAGPPPSVGADEGGRA
jgi:ADP-glucose pyrophosphorylase